MKKMISILLATVMVTAFAACGVLPAAPEISTPESGAPAESNAPATIDGKIAIITGTVSQGEEEFRAAENMKVKYGDMIITATYPDNFTKEQETTISNVENLVSQEGVKALIFVPAVPGASAAIAKAREINPDLLVIAGAMAEEPSLVDKEADLAYMVDELGMGISMMQQAAKLGAKTYVHYSFPRHMGVSMLSDRRDNLKKTAAEMGIEFVEAVAPDPTSDAGVPGAQQFINEDVPKKIAQYGKDTAFFATNCSMQEPLIRKVLEGGAIFPQQCCPSPYHAYPGALGVEIPPDKAGDVPFVMEEISKKIQDGSNPGRMGTWTTPINMMLIEAGVEYAREYISGSITEKCDITAMTKICEGIAGEGFVMEKFVSGETPYDKTFVVRAPFHVF